MSKVILLAEDSSDDEILFRRVMNSLGVTNPVHVVRDGRETIAFLKGEGAYSSAPKPGVLFLDLKMPGMDGWEVLRWLHSQNPRQEIPVIVLTAYGERGNLQEAYQLGASSFLFKPFNTAEMRDIIEHWADLWNLSETSPLRQMSSQNPKQQETSSSNLENGGSSASLRLPHSSS